MATTGNVESRTLLHFTDTLTRAVSLDLVRIASKLVEKETISLTQFRATQQQSKDDHFKANVLVTHVIDQVSLQPEKFESFRRSWGMSGSFRKCAYRV